MLAVGPSAASSSSVRPGPGDQGLLLRRRAVTLKVSDRISDRN